MKDDRSETIEMSNLEEMKYVRYLTITMIQCRTTVYPVKIIMKFCVDIERFSDLSAKKYFS